MYRLSPMMVGILAMAACAPLSPIGTSQSKKPVRIVSLDYCSDQFVLKLADRDQILALSKDATKEFSYLAKQAVGLQTVRAQAEDVIVLQPDLVVRSYGGGPGAGPLFERAGLPVAQLSYAEDFDDILANIRSMAKAFGHPERGEALVSEFETRLSGVQKSNLGPSALYTTPSGITGGHGTMINLILESAGVTNFQEQDGWNPIPLEHLARERPELIIAASFGSKTNHIDGWSPSRHPVARAQFKGQRIVPLNGALTSCGGWFVIEAVEAVAGAAAADQTESALP